LPRRPRRGPSAAAAGGGPAAVRHRRNRRAAALDLDPRAVPHAGHNGPRGSSADRSDRERRRARRHPGPLPARLRHRMLGLRQAHTRPSRSARLVGSLALAVTLIGFAVTDYETRQIDQWINAGLGMTMALTYVVVIVLL